MDKDYSLDALNRFLDYVADKGIMKGETAKGRKVAANKIFEKLSDDQRNDLRLVDLDQEAERFANRQGAGYLPASLQVYKSRVKSALTDFLAYVDSPMTFRPSTAIRAVNKQNVTGIKRKETSGESHKAVAQQEGAAAVTSQTSAVRHEADHLVFPIPIRPGLIVKVSNIPVDLTSSEAEKIAQVIKALAIGP